MGVPCVTLQGKGHAQNVGVSLLAAIGLRDGWVARTEEEYISLAVSLGRLIHGVVFVCAPDIMRSVRGICPSHEHHYLVSGG